MSKGDDLCIKGKEGIIAIEVKSGGEESISAGYRGIRRILPIIEETAYRCSRGACRAFLVGDRVCYFPVTSIARAMSFSYYSTTPGTRTVSRCDPNACIEMI